MKLSSALSNATAGKESDSKLGEAADIDGVGSGGAGLASAPLFMIVPPLLAHVTRPFGWTKMEMRSLLLALEPRTPAKAEPRIAALTFEQRTAELGELVKPAWSGHMLPSPITTELPDGLRLKTAEERLVSRLSVCSTSSAFFAAISRR